MRGGDRRLWGTEGCRSPTESSQIGILAEAQLSKQTLNFFRLFFQWVSVKGEGRKTSFLPLSPSQRLSSLAKHPTSSTPVRRSEVRPQSPAVSGHKGEQDWRDRRSWVVALLPSRAAPVLCSLPKPQDCSHMHGARDFGSNFWKTCMKNPPNCASSKVCLPGDRNKSQRVGCCSLATS